jgi:hypothetical protein
MQLPPAPTLARAQADAAFRVRVIVRAHNAREVFIEAVIVGGGTN